MSTPKAFFTLTDQVASVNSVAVQPMSPSYSLQLVFEGTTYLVDAKIQISIDGVNWVDLPDAVQLAIEDDTNTVTFDINAGFHNFVRVAVTRTSGTFDVKGYVSNGKEQWQTP
jgi:hypothetical protein